MMEETAVCIVGAGPAGSTLAHFLHKENIPFVLLDKSNFPRDKICGDGITVDVLNVLKRIDPDLLEKFQQQSEMLPSWGFSFHGPKGKELRYDLKRAEFPIAPFFTSRRLDLDHFLLENLPQSVGVFKPQCEVFDVKRQPKGMTVSYRENGQEKQLHCTLIIGAEGEKPVVSRHLGLEPFREKEHLLAAIRVYYRNIQGFHPHNHLEFFFDPSLLPGYFWIFPLSNNEANVGLGMLSTAIAAKKVNLKKSLSRIQEENPIIAPYFAEAEALEKPKGWGLPIMTPKRKIAGENYLLIGDAGGMIEAFTGKGIGPGMMSARIASEHIAAAFRSSNFDMSSYHRHMYRYYRSEITNTYRLQKSLKYPPLLNAAIGFANLGSVRRYAEDRMVRDFVKWL